MRTGSRVCVNAPAKLNLFLELHERRKDGYHELETLMVPINLYDSVAIKASDDSAIRLTCNWTGGTPESLRDPMPPSSDNLAHRAAVALRQHAGICSGAEIEIVKRIPTRAGLGGGSADAAATLVAANAAWETAYTRDQLAEIAAGLGSDVPFFLYDSPALCTGRGEIISPISMSGRLDFVIVKPPFGLSTPEVFKASQVSSTPASVDSLISALDPVNPAKIGSMLLNRLQQAAQKLTPWVEKIAGVMRRLSVHGHQMSGSGTSYFAICRNQRQARQIAAKLRATRLGSVFAASTAGPYPVR